MSTLLPPIDYSDLSKSISPKRSMSRRLSALKERLRANSKLRLALRFSSWSVPS
tara:strand:+ start:505 stop:666 length:162 start_codon:yes stop_codon:yes gene_type:complete